jgi:hypothetical protein
MSWKEILKGPLTRDEVAGHHRARIEELIDIVDKRISEESKEHGKNKFWVRLDRPDRGSYSINVGSGRGTSKHTLQSLGIKPNDGGMAMRHLYRVWKNESDAEVTIKWMATTGNLASIVIEIQFSGDVKFGQYEGHKLIDDSLAAAERDKAAR